ncbi:nitrilase-related carbon-nitrogen hydrolase [Pseudomonas aeruginosa]|nr:nitrilase-related carbon-nitrogen hydrolase [Pseudomonas aeruginosa]
MRIAQARGVRLLVFPEHRSPATNQRCRRPRPAGGHALLQPLRQLAEQARMTTVVGLPLRSPKHAKPPIAALILGADGSLGVYAKQHLHAGEERHFSAGDGGPCGDRRPADGVGGLRRLQPTQPPGPRRRAGARLYIASALIGENGYPADPALLAGCAAPSTEWACCWPTMAGRRVAGRRRAGVRFGMSGSAGQGDDGDG